MRTGASEIIGSPKREFQTAKAPQQTVPTFPTPGFCCRPAHPSSDMVEPEEGYGRSHRGSLLGREEALVLVDGAPKVTLVSASSSCEKKCSASEQPCNDKKKT